jgi:hypothetical protein
MGRLKYGYLKCPPGFKEKVRRGHRPQKPSCGFIKPASAEDRKQEAMAEVKAAPAKKISRKKDGFKRVVVELTNAHYEALDKLAVEDLRNGGPTEMLTVLARLNLDTLIKNHRPAQMTITDSPFKGNSEKLQLAEEVPGRKSRNEQ